MAAHQPICVVDLGFGDAGKGTIVDSICSEISPYPKVGLVVRFNSGPQAGHNVWTPDGREHTFSMFGSGTFHRVPTYLSEYVFINPYNIVAEAEHLAVNGVDNPLKLLWIDRFCPVITPYHKAANQLRERQRGVHRHGSCGHGHGEAVKADFTHPGETIRACDLHDWDIVRAKLLLARARLYDEFGVGADRGLPSLDQIVSDYMKFATMNWRITSITETLEPALDADLVVFEGAQGVLLDEWFGFHPHTTWSTTTPRNAVHLVKRVETGTELYTIGVVRTHMTRHGAGPFPTESETLTENLPDPSNTTGTWQGPFRVGYFDVPLLRYAIACCGGGEERISALAVTHVDRMIPRICKSYMLDGEQFEPMPHPVLADEEAQLDLQATLGETLNRVTPIYRDYIHPHGSMYANSLGLPVDILSSGPTWKDKEFVPSSQATGTRWLRTDLRTLRH